MSEVLGSTWWDASTWDLGDEPIDNHAVTPGIKLWQKYKDTMTKAQFQNELADYIPRLSHYKPRTRSVDSSIIDAYPYRERYFNNIGNDYKISDD
jgi:hypothetical protein